VAKFWILDFGFWISHRKRGDLPGGDRGDHRRLDSRQVMLQQIGAFADDDSLSELTEAIYQARGRSEID
jgi:hypothetical protein